MKIAKANSNAATEVTSTRRHVKVGGLEVEQNTELFVAAWCFRCRRSWENSWG